MEPEQDLDEDDTEGMTSHWVQAKLSGAKPKVHLPAASCFLHGKTLEAVPKCGTSGAFDFVKAEEPLDSEALCKRCSRSGTEGGL